jgi:hypothetical protein
VLRLGRWVIGLIVPVILGWGYALAIAQTEVSLTRLPIGDGQLSDAPTVGSVWSCSTAFGRPGALVDGPWIRPDGTFDLLAKAVVDGEVSWPSELSITREGETRAVSGNLLPGHPTGQYPIARTDDAYQYDRNPNAIATQSFTLTLPALPTVFEVGGCLPMGPIGIMLTGSPIFNALDAGGLDAVAHEVQDRCGGHPQQGGVYHYHSLPACLDDEGDGHSARMGYAFDGFGIYGRWGTDGEVLTNAELDACHGHVHAIAWDGEWLELYHYHATWEYPYTLGCYRGSASRRAPVAPAPQPSTVQPAVPDEPATEATILVKAATLQLSPSGTSILESQSGRLACLILALAIVGTGVGLAAVVIVSELRAQRRHRQAAPGTLARLGVLPPIGESFSRPSRP